jgi:hypothetical protein
MCCSGSANAQSPVAGQPYQIPDGYGSYATGTLINYGGYNYVIQSNATMLLADQSSNSSQPADDTSTSQAYQIPDGYGDNPVGTVISYGGASYVIQSNGTMVPADQGTDSLQDTGQAYQIPTGYTNYPAGTVILYGGSNYRIGLNGTMLLVVSRTQYSRNYGPNGSASRPAQGPAVNPNSTRNPNNGRQPFVGPNMTRNPNNGRQPFVGPNMTRNPNNGRQPFVGPNMTRNPNNGRGPTQTTRTGGASFGRRTR